MGINCKTVISWNSRKKKSAFFVMFILLEETFHVSSQCIVYWINFINIYTFIYQKTLLHTLLLLVFKIVERLQCILRHFKSSDIIVVKKKSLLKSLTAFVILMSLACVKKDKIIAERLDIQIEQTRILI